MHRLLIAALALIVPAGTAWGQTPSRNDQSEMIQTLSERIERLEKRLRELEGKVETRGDTSGRLLDARLTAKVEPQQAGHEQHATPTLTQQPSQTPEGIFPSLQIRGFADVNFSATDQPGTTSGFNLGQFALHLNAPLSKKVSFIGEISFSARSTGFLTEVERSVIRYDYNDHFKVSFGRYHTPINYWNTAFHHGLWLQTTVSRPEMIQFGGQFLPVHFVGLLAEGTIPSGKVGLNYNVGLGNGRNEIISRAGDASDNNNNRAWLVNLLARPANLYGLQVGVSFYGDKITSTTVPNAKELITSAHIVWTKETPEFLAEFANVRHRDIATGQVVNSQAYYAQLGFRLPWQDKRWKPYYRFEYTHVPTSEVVLSVPNLVGSTVGIRYDISEFAAFKGEYRSTKRAPGQRFNGLFVQTSFTF